MLGFFSDNYVVNAAIIRRNFCSQADVETQCLRVNDTIVVVPLLPAPRNNVKADAVVGELPWPCKVPACI